MIRRFLSFMVQHRIGREDFWMRVIRARFLRAARLVANCHSLNWTRHEYAVAYLDRLDLGRVADYEICVMQAVAQHLQNIITECETLINQPT